VDNVRVLDGERERHAPWRRHRVARHVLAAEPEPTEPAPDRHNGRQRGHARAERVAHEHEAAAPAGLRHHATQRGALAVEQPHGGAEQAAVSVPSSEGLGPAGVEEEAVVLWPREAQAAHGEHHLPAGAVVEEAVRRAERRRGRRPRRLLVVVVGGERGAAGARDGREGGGRGSGPRRAVVGAREGEAAGHPPRAGEGERALGGAGEGHGARTAWKRGILAGQGTFREGNDQGNAPRVSRDTAEKIQKCLDRRNYKPSVQLRELLCRTVNYYSYMSHSML